MASLGYSVNTNDLPESTNFAPIPAGEYVAMVESAEVVQTKSGGQMVKVTWVVMSEAYQNRKVWQNINLRHPTSKQAEEIGAKSLGEILRALGISRLDDTDQLVGGNAVISVKIRKSEEYGDSNDVKYVKAIEGSTAPGAPTPAAAGGKPPWAK